MHNSMKQSSKSSNRRNRKTKTCLRIIYRLCILNPVQNRNYKQINAQNTYNVYIGLREKILIFSRPKSDDICSYSKMMSLNRYDFLPYYNLITV